MSGETGCTGVRLEKVEYIISMDLEISNRRLKDRAEVHDQR